MNQFMQISSALKLINCFVLKNMQGKPKWRYLRRFAYGFNFINATKVVIIFFKSLVCLF